MKALVKYTFFLIVIHHRRCIIIEIIIFIGYIFPEWG